MKSNDKITNLASIQIFELLVIMDQINKGYAIADYKYRLWNQYINLALNRKANYI